MSLVEIRTVQRKAWTTSTIKQIQFRNQYHKNANIRLRQGRFKRI